VSSLASGGQVSTLEQTQCTRELLEKLLTQLVADIKGLGIHAKESHEIFVRDAARRAGTALVKQSYPEFHTLQRQLQAKQKWLEGGGPSGASASSSSSSTPLQEPAWRGASQLDEDEEELPPDAQQPIAQSDLPPQSARHSVYHSQPSPPPSQPSPPPSQPSPPLSQPGRSSPSEQSAAQPPPAPAQPLPQQPAESGAFANLAVQQPLAPGPHSSAGGSGLASHGSAASLADALFRPAPIAVHAVLFAPSALPNPVVAAPMAAAAATATPAPAPAPALAPARSAQATDGSVSCERVSAAAPVVDAPSAAAEAGEVAWAVPAADLAKYDAIFDVAKEADGKISGTKAAAVLNRSGLPRETLRAVWSLVDICNAGKIDREWFALAMHLTARARRGKPLPPAGLPLPLELVPLSQRREYATLVDQAWRAQREVRGEIVK
jgi:hypothetical protein